MIESERPSAHNLEAAEKTGNVYLSNLGFEWSELRGKRVLDIGAMNAKFENAARRRGVEVISMDYTVVDGDMPPADSRFVVANATKLPFKGDSFDYALAHMSVMNYLEEGYKEDYLRYIEDALREACRILKPGGQFRFTPTLLDEVELRHGEADVVPQKRSNAYNEWKMPREHKFLEEMARRCGFQSLKVIKYPDSHPEKKKSRLSHHYYIATKAMA